MVHPCPSFTCLATEFTKVKKKPMCISSSCSLPRRETNILGSSSRNSNLCMMSLLPHHLVTPSAHYECSVRVNHRILESIERGTSPPWTQHSGFLLRSPRRCVWMLEEPANSNLGSRVEEVLLSTRAKRLYLWVVVGGYCGFSPDRKQARRKDKK